MSAPSPNSGPRPSIARFGLFEADLAARELRKQGLRIRIQEQPFAVLAALVQRPGTIVTREELRARLWPADTFVDFDHSLNTAVNKIREVLGDSAVNPRYIETVAKRGYRFLGDVKFARSAPASPTAATVDDHPQPEVSARRGVVRVLFALIQIMYLVFYLEALFHWQAVDRISVLDTGSMWLPWLVLVTGAVGIPLRFFLLSGVAFDYAKLGLKFHRIFLGILTMDLLWAVAPFLIVEKLGFGVAFAATAALLYVPFAERTLIRMAYSQDGRL